jgi:hypothetical protein
MNDLINKLPLDIVNYIIPYTYNLQPKNLLLDIVNLNITKAKLMKLYYNFWIIEMQSIDQEEDKGWLINDLFAYSNNDKATMYGYVDNFYQIFKRNIFLQSKDNIDNYILNLEKKKLITQINIFLGLFTIKERKDFFIFIAPRLNSLQI